jgi:hypothetical protein
MKKSLVLIAVVGFASASFADNDHVPPGLEKKGRVPPGLAKKGGVPPGQAKKEEQTNGPAPVAVATPTAPAASAPTAPTLSYSALKVKLDREVELVNDRVHDTHLQSTTLREISRLTGVPVARLEQQQQDHHAGFAGLLLGNLIIKEKNASFKNLIEERNQATSWSVIAQRRNVSLQPLIDSTIELKRHINQVARAR